MEEFRGSVTRHHLSSGSGLNTLYIDDHHIVLTSRVHPDVTIARPETRAVRFRRIRLPLWWTTEVTFDCDGPGQHCIFKPGARGPRLRARLEHQGWPVAEASTLSLASLFRERPVSRSLAVVCLITGEVLGAEQRALAWLLIVLATALAISPSELHRLWNAASMQRWRASWRQHHVLLAALSVVTAAASVLAADAMESAWPVALLLVAWVPLLFTPLAGRMQMSRRGQVK